MKIVIFHHENMSRDLVTKQFEYMGQLQQTWLPSQPYLALHDASHTRTAILSPDFRRYMMQVTRANPSLCGRFAFVLPYHLEPFFDGLKDLLGMAILPYQAQMQVRLFSDYDKGLRWLEDTLDKSESLPEELPMKVPWITYQQISSD